MEQPAARPPGTTRPAFGQSPHTMVMLALASLAVITVLDMATPYELGFSSFYVVPVLIATWGAGPERGLMFALLAASIWYGLDLSSGRPCSWEGYRLWDAGSHLATYGLVAVVTGRLRAVRLREQESAAATQPAAPTADPMP